jgi:hypothetical protein
MTKGERDKLDSVLDLLAVLGRRMEKIEANLEIIAHAVRSQGSRVADLEGRRLCECVEECETTQ